MPLCYIHPTFVNGLMCASESRKSCIGCLVKALYMEYTDPGYLLFKVARSMNTGRSMVKNHR